MGKGYQNFMCKKFFHPNSLENIKKKWMAEQKKEFDDKEQNDKIEQYKREQEMLTNRALMGDKKAQLGLTFMYDVPSIVKQDESHSGKEVKFEWQRKYQAPRESYAKADDEILDQPFGIEVRNIRCIRCRQWGHQNTDRVCPLFFKSLTHEPPKPGQNPADVLKQSREAMKENGLVYKGGSAWDRGEEDSTASNGKEVVIEDDEQDAKTAFIASLTKEQRLKLLKKLEKQEAKELAKHVKKSDPDAADHKTKHERKEEKHRRNDSDRHRICKRRKTFVG